MKNLDVSRDVGGDVREDMNVALIEERDSCVSREQFQQLASRQLAAFETESVTRYRNLADSIPHIVWRSKPDGSIDYLNRKWTECTGLREQQSLGFGWQSAFHPFDLRKLLKNWMGSKEASKGFQVECRVMDRSKQWRWHLLQCVPEHSATGELIAWLFTGTDIHERILGHDRLIEARRKANMASVAKTTFLANMSHEIRTPLNSILGFADLIMSSARLSDEQISSAEIIKRNGQQLLKIVDEILDFSNVEADQLELENVEVAPKAILDDLSLFFNRQASKKQIRFSLMYVTPIPEQIVIDRTRYRQILTNLLGNSIKFTERGEVAVEVAWYPDENSSEGILSCSIRDTGLGILPEQVDRLFEPFVQGDSSTTRRFGGTGLGLALSRRLARSLGGDVRLVQTTHGKGSKFVVEVVAHGARLVESQQQSDLTEATTVGDLVLTPKLLDDVAVLVVDDASDNRMLLTRYLKAVGAKVECAEDGEEGVRKALERTYDVVLMDIQMPQMDGYTATSKLRDCGYTKPIIALTAHALKDERAKSIKAGCDGHLTKPIDKRQLVGYIARYLGLR